MAAQKDETRTTWVRRIRQHPSGILLAVQLGGVLLYPFMDESAAGRIAFETFGALVLLLAMWAVRASAGVVWISIVLGSGGALLSIVDAAQHHPVLEGGSAVLHALFYFYAAGALMVYMLSDRRVTSDELFAVGATFTLVAWGFAYVFVLLQVIQPGCFTAAVDPQAARSWTELLFLSFTNLSSTGLSDIAPITPHARSVVMIEQLAGLGSVALVVSRLVGLTMNKHT